MKRLLALLLCLALVPVSAVPVRGDDSDIFGANIQPNVLILLDTSGSMDDTIPASPYDPGTTYTGTRTGTAVYQKSSRGRYSIYANTLSAITSSSARTSLSTVGYWSGRLGGNRVNLFMGNYLNYQTSPSGAQQKKIDIAKRVLKNLIDNTEGVRFGVMRFINNSSMGHGGAGMVAAIGSSLATIDASIDAISPSGYTPLGEALRDIGNYYKGTFGTYGTPIQNECQPNFVILISDGLQNGTVDVRTEATLRRTQDHSTTYAGTQNVLVHTIGFLVAASEQDAANDILQTTATNGGGTFYTSDNETQLEDALQDAIRQIVAATFTFATPVVPTTSTTGSSRAYLAAFQSNPSGPFWSGFLKAYQRGSDGKVPVDSTTGIPLDSALVWEAGQVLADMAAADRTIYTVVGSSRQPFTKTNTAITATLLGGVSNRDSLIDFIRGEGRDWKLGDIFHSSPVLVTPPFLPLADASYQTFRSANSTRTAILLAGANDGMLHAFRESDGAELWAFIPPDLLASLQDLTAATTDHPFFVDSSPIAVDVKIQIAGDTAPQWRTVVVFGERRGGRTYHALDITDTTNPVYLWSFTDSKMGESWSEPIIAKVKISDGSERYVAFAGGGYDTAQNNDTGKAFFAIDVATGQKLWEYYKASGATDDRRYMNYSLAANPAGLDLNGDGYVDRLYIGDINGQLWKFDIPTDGTTLSSGLATNWTGKLLFASAGTPSTTPPATGEYFPAQAIYASINAALDDAADLWIYFGTGDRNHPNHTSTNRFYGIKDNTTMTNGSILTEADLVPTASQGWYFTMGSDEKVLAAADIFNKIVFFSTFTPTTSAACGSGGGTAKLYAVQMATGFAALDWTNGLALASTDSSQTRSKVIGTGIPSKPIVIITESGATLTTSVVAATTSQQLPSNPAPPPSAMRRIRYWLER